VQRDALMKGKAGASTGRSAIAFPKGGDTDTTRKKNSIGSADKVISHVGARESQTEEI